MSGRVMAISLVLTVLTLLPARPSEGKPTGAEESVRAADQNWSRVFGAKNLDKSVNACAQNASVLAPNAPRATGREAIRALFAGFFALPDLSISWQPTEVRVARSRDLAYTSGSYQMSFKTPTGQTVSDHGKYLTAWEKQRDGSWSVVQDAFNSDLPPAPASP